MPSWTRRLPWTWKGWTAGAARDLVSLYVMLGIGAAIMLYVQFRGQVGLLQHAAGDPSSPPPTTLAYGRTRSPREANGP
jgi:hypothetical protein